MSMEKQARRVSKGKPSYQVPFEANGSIPHYFRGYITYEWRDPEPFEATLKLHTYDRGRSAAYFIMQSSTGATYTVFITDLMDMIEDARWISGSITATFIPVKRGMNYGVRLVVQEETK